MRSISVELRFEIHKHRTTRSEFLIGNGLLKFCVSFVDLRVECGGVKLLARHGKLVNEREVKTAAAQRKTFRDKGVDFMLRSFKSPILRRFGLTCQHFRTAASSVPKPAA